MTSRKTPRIFASQEDFQEFVDLRRRSRMDSVDRLTEGQRLLVHEYGLNVVNAIMQSGVTRPANIRHIVETVLDEFSPTRGSSSHQGPKSELAKVRPNEP